MILEAFDLTGRVAMVTGASRGLGQGIAVGLAEAGADIVGVSRGSCAETHRAVTALGRRFVHLPCDLGVASPADLATLVAQAVEAMGRLDILVNAAGTTIRHPFLEYPPEDWEHVMQVNLNSLMFHRVGAVLSGGCPGCTLRGIQACRGGRHQGDGQRTRLAKGECQRDRAGLYAHRSNGRSGGRSVT
jgi:NAD(P)-dependent dehydrogenase (short-subunit alcohol dehydrogenase family)